MAEISRSTIVAEASTIEKAVRSSGALDKDHEGQDASIETLPHTPEQREFPSGSKLFLIIGSLMLALFLVALDRTIVSTAIPKISDTFHSLDDIGWYGSAYLLSSSALQLLYGRIYKFYSIKWVFLATIVIFEVGSVVCGSAPSSDALIVGRAIAGAGAAGIFSGGQLIMVHTVPLHRRPLFQGLLGSVFGLSSVIGPLLGGAFTQNASLTWRWCFYINLPIGAFALVIISIFLKTPPAAEPDLPLRCKISRLDPLGTAVFIPCVVCLLLALQWGGTTYEWTNWRIPLLFALAAVFLGVFIAIEIWKGESATLPPRIVCQRSVAFATWYSFCVFSSMMVSLYYLPLWFQAIKGSSAVESGIHMIPLVLSILFSSLVGGIFTSRIGYYVPNMAITPCVSSAGAGLMTTWEPSTSSPEWIGYQVLYGAGLGFGIQSANLAIQAVLPWGDIPIGTALVMFAQQLGGAVFLSVADNIFTNSLMDGLAEVPGVNPSGVLSSGATGLRNVPPAALASVIQAYNNSVIQVFYVSAALAALGVLGAVGVEFRSIRGGDEDGSSQKIRKFIAKRRTSRPAKASRRQLDPDVLEQQPATDSSRQELIGVDTVHAGDSTCNNVFQSRKR